MPIQLSEESGGKILVVHVSGMLIKADYGHFVPEFSATWSSTESRTCCST